MLYVDVSSWHITQPTASRLFWFFYQKLSASWISLQPAGNSTFAQKTGVCVPLETERHGSLSKRNFVVSFSLTPPPPPPCLLFVSFLLTCPLWSPPCCPLHVMSSYSCVSRLGESSLIGGVSADRLTNSLFINGLSVPGSQRSQRTIQFSSIDFMSPCRAIFITGIKTLIKGKK